MKHKKYIAIILLVAFFASCKKKKYPESTTENDQVFYLSATIDNNPIVLSAGSNGYYMYSSYTQNANGVYSLVADLRQSDCSNCPNSLQVEINDFKVSAINAPVVIDSALVPGSYSISAGPTYSVQFVSSYNKPVLNYLWNFGDGTSSTQANPIHSYSKAGKYKVNLTVTSTGGCVGSISGEEKVGIAGCKSSIQLNSVSGNTISLTQNVSGATPYNYLWNFGDGSTSTQTNPAHVYSLTGSYPVTLKVTDALGDTSYSKYNVVTQADNSSCAANYSVGLSGVESSPLNLSKIKIRWIDENGVAYTSDNSSQPLNSSFQITSVKDFENNENGEKTKKIGIKFTCRVYNGSSYKTINNADAVICVSYK